MLFDDPAQNSEKGPAIASGVRRVARVLYLRQLAVEVFEDQALAVEWMRRPHAELAGLSPLDMLDTQPGYDRARDLLLRVIHGVSV